MIEQLIGFSVLFPLFMVAVMIHEVSHGWVALSLGDPTAKEAGRLTLNPLKHMDPVGTVALPLILLLLRAPFVFGWAKPVPINPFLLRHPKRDLLWVGLAGPAANLALAVVAAALVQILGPVRFPLAASLLRTLALISLVLGTFNLLPIPPLDGSRILAGLLPAQAARLLLLLEQWGIVLVVALLYLGVLDRVLWPIVRFLARALGVMTG